MAKIEQWNINELVKTIEEYGSIKDYGFEVHYKRDC